MLDLYVCLRPVRWFTGTQPRQGSGCGQHDDLPRELRGHLCGIEFEQGTDEGSASPRSCRRTSRNGLRRSASPETSGFGIKPTSQEGTERLVTAAIEYAIANGSKSVTLVHKGNIMKFTEGAFQEWGYQDGARSSGPWILRAALGRPSRHRARDWATWTPTPSSSHSVRPKEYDVIACMNLNGDYISDALAAQVGESGIAPAGISTTRPAMRSSRLPTAPRRNTRARTR